MQMAKLRLVRSEPAPSYDSVLQGREIGRDCAVVTGSRAIFAFGLAPADHLPGGNDQRRKTGSGAISGVFDDV
jgi:hypothetical protein